MKKFKLFNFRVLAKNIWVGSLALSFSSCVYAASNGTQELRQKLESYQAMSADFKSEVRSKSGSVSISSGKMAIKRPDSLLLHTLEPDETILFTKGQDLCYYDPFVNQLSLFKRSSSYSSPFLLLTDSSDKLWNEYSVAKVGEDYIVLPKNIRDITSMTLRFTDNVVSSITLGMKDGSVNTYSFVNVQMEADASMFAVEIPEDAEIDDERGAN